MRCRLALELVRLLLKLQKMLKLSITPVLWADNSQYARDLVSVTYMYDIMGIPVCWTRSVLSYV